MADGTTWVDRATPGQFFSGVLALLCRSPAMPTSRHPRAFRAPLIERFQLKNGFLQVLAPDVFERQPSAILELFEDKNVILNTPTGSGKSLVAAAVHFQALARGRRPRPAPPVCRCQDEWPAGGGKPVPRSAGCGGAATAPTAR